MFGHKQKDSLQKSGSQHSDEFLLHVDRALENFGSTVKSVVYYRFHEEQGLGREDIAEKPELFIATIDRFFGPGSNTVKSFIEAEMRRAVAPIDLGRGNTSEILSRARDCFSGSSK